ncbi:hypothetical protein [Cupriavidus sp. YAF13]|uniref:hypothetical protein n=1 Tax=Cupriavidus sp. YAF13 TaxID=3233075 RepID=UPI003F8E2125
MDGWAGKPQDFNMPANLGREQTARGAVVWDCRATGKPRACGKIAALRGKRPKASSREQGVNKA